MLFRSEIQEGVMESAEKGGRMSSPHVDEEKRGKATVYKGKKKKKEGIGG